MMMMTAMLCSLCWVVSGGKSRLFQEVGYIPFSQNACEVFNEQHWIKGCHVAVEQKDFHLLNNS